MSLKSLAAVLGAVAVAVTGVLAPVQASADDGVPLDPWTRVAVGSYHMVAIDPDGQVRAWGDNTYGQLGDGSQTQSTDPVRVEGVGNAVAVAAYDQFSVAVTGSG
ncbi:MAG: hypothetical protein LBJ08_02125, partial [Bifidobacteriaceae bacterium]|nr:hypothetical protein [Bifidobacteriaceae bacterium]